MVPAQISILRVQCLPGKLIDLDPTTAGIQPECVLEETEPGDAGSSQARVFPACRGAAGEAACWTPVPDVTCQSGLRLDLQRACTPTAGSLQRLSCATGG